MVTVVVLLEEGPALPVEFFVAGDEEGEFVAVVLLLVLAFELAVDHLAQVVQLLPAVQPLALLDVRDVPLQVFGQAGDLLVLEQPPQELAPLAGDGEAAEADQQAARLVLQVVPLRPLLALQLQHLRLPLRLLELLPDYLQLD